MAITSANRYLSRAEMEGNAAVLYKEFALRGWSIQAIAAMLGNMESESGINPGIYENLDSTSTTNGFGLVQWTPNTKYKNWVDANGYGSNYGDIYTQIARICYELDHGLQWIPTEQYPISFAEFSKSKSNPEYLAQAFLFNYERPENLEQLNRSTQARHWYDFIIAMLGDEPPIDIPSLQQGMPKLLLYFGGTHRR